MNDCTFNSQYFEIDVDQSVDGNSENAELLVPQQMDVDNTEMKNEDDEDEETLWSIDDDTLFYPLGLINHGTESKSVFVTWSENYLLNYVFKKSKRNERTKLTKVRLDVHAEEIRHILILEFNTLLLMQSGRVFHFSSVKSMHPFKWLQGVRCISAASGGFSVIRLLSDNRLQLEVYEDVMNIDRNESTLKQSYDITFDETNLFNCEWKDERLTLISQNVDEMNMLLLESLIGHDIKLKDKCEIHFFTVSGNVFALIPDSESSEGANYQIKLCATYASNVELIKIHNERQPIFLVFLQCSSIDMWYISDHTQLLRRNSYCIGSQIIHYEFANNGCFYYADAGKVARLKFDYVPDTDMCCARESSKAVYGILACTWMENIQRLICLSCNNIFYQLTFDDDNTDDSVECEHLNELYELTPAKMARLMEQAHILKEWQATPEEIHKSIEREYVKQELITVATKASLYRKLCSATLEFRQFLPSKQSDTIIMHTNTSCTLNSNSLFALIYVKVTKHYIFKDNVNWQLHLTNNTSKECHILSVAHDQLHKTLCLVVPIIRCDQKLLPEFQIILNSFINNEVDDYAAVSLPIKIVRTPETFKYLFSFKQACLINYAEHNLFNLISTFNKLSAKHHPKNQSTLIHSRIELQTSCNFETVLKFFRSTMKRKSSVETRTQLLSSEMYFMSNRFSLLYSPEDNSIHIECEDAAILYYVKYFIICNLRTGDGGYNLYADRRKLLMQYQSEVEHCYGQMASMDHTESLHLENLLRIYKKLRNS